MDASHPQFMIEKLDESGGLCECCGQASRSVWGFVHQGETTVAAYWLHWTVGHLDEPGANLDLIVGSWGDKAAAEDRTAISLLYREPEDAPPAFMVIDAPERPIANSDLVGSAMLRADVVGTPLAAHVFSLVDAIWVQDERFF